MPTKIIEMISNRTSLFLIWLSSCAITLCNSSSSNFSIIPFDKLIAYVDYADEVVDLPDYLQQD